jgi:two-component system NtrC family sensor kinase
MPLLEENRTLLIVDDEPETLKGYADFLTAREAPAARRSSRSKGAEEPQAAGSGPSAGERYNLLLAKSGEEALELVKKELAEGRRVAAGFFDVKLEGGMDGLATIAAIKALDKDLHCVVVTAYHDRSVEEINRLFGEEFKDQWDYLNKPFTQGEIVQKARQMVAAWNRRREVEAVHAQLVRSERLAAVGQVARGVGHEFGNILLRIIGKTDLALMEKDAAKIHDHLKVVMTAAERAGTIVRNLQSFSKAEPRFQVSSLTLPLDESLSLVNHELVKASVKLEKRYSQVPEVRMDAGGLSQVFLNLFINAAFAMSKGGGTLTVTLEAAQGPDPAGGRQKGVAARIADTGTGIPPEVLPRIFDFAYTTKGDRGSGLGLSVSREIVEAHGGRIWVRTEVGKGTEFTVWLPL